MNVRGCKISDAGFQELISSKNLRNLTVLIARDNRIKCVKGPFGDLEEATEK